MPNRHVRPVISPFDVAVFGDLDGPYFSCRRVVEDEDGVRAVEPNAPPQEGEFASVYLWRDKIGQWQAASDHVDIETARIVAADSAETTVLLH